ncbi:MAG: 7-cyano-7-deazaguanine synthase QueC [Planctomycetes bacterium]|nr:7-cyano-7-deazaguanine synthase QueC [Planctomycetota bacterium]
MGKEEDERRRSQRRALVLFSGGVDSTTTLHMARAGGFRPIALIFHYGQRHEVEVEMARRRAEELGVPWRLARIDLRETGGSALTSDDIDVPRGRSLEEIARGSIPPTYVPARNTIFLAHALARAEVERIDDIFLGINAVDYSGYPDCRSEFIEAFERMANLACRRYADGDARLTIHAPLLHMTKAEIIRRGTELGVDYSRTWSCYAPLRVAADEKGSPGAGPQAVACGECDSCLLRKKGFREAGIEDPAQYGVK